MTKPRLAIIEDDEFIRESYRDTFTGLSKECGIDGFEIETADSQENARALLWKARDEKRPFDAVLFDLGLPKNNASLASRDRAEVGIELLQQMRAEEVIKPDDPFAYTIVVVSAHFRAAVLQELIRTQLVQDFVEKTFDPGNEKLLAVVVGAYRRGQQRQWERYKQRRLVRWLTEASRAGVGRLARVVTNGVSEAIGEMRQLIQVIEEEQHLSVSLDQDNPVCRQCLSVRDSVMQIAKKCATERDTLYRDDDATREQPTQTVVALLEHASDAVCSGMAGKVIQLERGTDSLATVATTLYYAQNVLEEVMYGAIDASGADQTVTTEMKLCNDGLTVAVSVFDQGQPLSPDQVSEIHRAETGRLPIGGRAWGLALAQYVALNVGGRLEVAAGESGNCVTLHLPVERR